MVSQQVHLYSPKCGYLSNIWFDNKHDELVIEYTSNIECAHTFHPFYVKEIQNILPNDIETVEA